jgi:hypothetical protein
MHPLRCPASTESDTARHTSLGALVGGRFLFELGAFATLRHSSGILIISTGGQPIFRQRLRIRLTSEPRCRSRPSITQPAAAPRPCAGATLNLLNPYRGCGAQQVRRASASTRVATGSGASP